MSENSIDLTKLRAALRKMERGDLLMIAERAVELLPQEKLQSVIGDYIRIVDIAGAAATTVSLLDEVKRFQTASRRGDYYQDFAVDSKNFEMKSEGTDAFISEFDRLMRKCVRASESAPRAPTREAFEILFGLLRYIDESNDDVIFFADEGGAWQLGVDFPTVLPAWFRCLADDASPEEFAEKVDAAISDFDDHDRPSLLAAARGVANAGQKTALRGRLEKRKK